MNRINWLGVAVATVVAFFIGFLWYGLIFQEQWMALTGVTDEGSGDSMWMLLGVVQTFVTMAGLGWFIGRDGGGWMHGLKIGLIAGVCFALMTSAYGFIYQTSPMGLLPIDWSHLLVVYAVGGAIVGGLRLKPKA
jgi:hypothetical protein